MTTHIVPNINIFFALIGLEWFSLYSAPKRTCIEPNTSKVIAIFLLFSMISNLLVKHCYLVDTMRGMLNLRVDTKENQVRSEYLLLPNKFVD